MQAGSWSNNFPPLDESCGPGMMPSTHYTNPNNVHQHLDQGAGAAPFPSLHMSSTCAITFQQHCVPGSRDLHWD